MKTGIPEELGIPAFFLCFEDMFSRNKNTLNLDENLKATKLPFSLFLLIVSLVY